MCVRQILKSWGILLPEECDESLPEILLEKYSEKCYFADFFPKAISITHADKHSQLENKIYNLICTRMYNVVLKLWVYDNLYFGSELLPSRTVIKKKFLRRKLLKQMETNCIEKEQHLRILMQLSKQNIIDLVLVFENLHIVIVPSWSCYFMFVEDSTSLALIKEVVHTEGLHLRNTATD